MKAVVLAGGFGTRLRPLTSTLPKPMVPMANRPMMEHILVMLRQHGFSEILTLLYFQPEEIRGYFGDGHHLNLSMKYLTPDADLGTAGCIKFAEQDLKKGTFLISSADVLTDFDLTAAVEFHKKKRAIATMVLTRVTNPLAYGGVIINEDSRITRFLEKPSWGEVFSDTVNTGIYILEPEVLNAIPEKQPFDFSKDLFPKLLAKGAPIFGYVAQGYWKDVGDLREYRLAHRDILDGKVSIQIPGHKKILWKKESDATVWADKGVSIEESVEFVGNVILGKNCRIEKGAKLENCVIGDGCIIEPYAQLSQTVLWKHVRVGQESVIREAVIGNHAKLGARTLVQVGAIIADECTIGTDAKIRSNVKIWPHKTIEDGAILATSLIWGEKWTRSLFGGYGISGLGNIEITPEFAAKVGAAYGAYLGKNAYVITSRDAHNASRMIKRSIISGLLSAGVRVGDLKTAPVSVVRYEMGKEGEAGGVHVRKSPFDPRIIDIKFLNKDGGDIAFQQEKAIEQLFLREDFKRAPIDESGELVSPPRTLEFYKAGFLKQIRKEELSQARLKVVLDYSFSPAAITFPPILGELGIDVVSLNAYTDPHKITRSEKDFENSLQQLSSIVTTLKADIGFLIDNGAEKVFIVDERGKIISNAQALAAVAYLTMKSYDRGHIAVPLNQSSVFEKLAVKSRLKVTRTPTLPRHILSSAKVPDMRLVSDGIGGFIFPEFQKAFDAMYTIGKILEMMAHNKIRIGKLLKQIPFKMNVHHKQLPCPWDKKGQVMRLAFDHAKGRKPELLEGVKIHFRDAWVLMVPDPDAAYFHLYVESDNESRAKSLIKEYSKKIITWTIA